MITPRNERYKIYEHNVHIGYFHVDISTDGQRLSAELFKPSESFVLLSDKNGKVTHEQIEDWVFERIVPPTRIGIDDLLRQMGLSEYDKLEILKYTSARHTSDTCTIDFSCQV
jgi:hypothetical protein